MSLQVDKNYPPTRIPDIRSLKLPLTMLNTLSQEIYKERILWEPWLQTAENYEGLKKDLRKRGYKNVPMASSPQFAQPANRQAVDIGLKPLEKKTMSRKRKF